MSASDPSVRFVNVRRVFLLIHCANLCLLSFASSSARAQQQAEQPVAADTFVDSVGVNVHLSYTRTPYFSNFPLIQQSLLALGVRHVRDGMVDFGPKSYYYDRHNALGRLGIHGEFTTSTTQSADLLKTWPTRVPDSFEAYEGPNEMDKKPNGIDALRTFMPVLYTAAKSGFAPKAYVIGPSLTKDSSYTEIGDLTANQDFGNLHNYFSNRPPGTPGWGPNGYGSIRTNLAHVAVTSKSQPVYTTETGYTNDPKIPAYLSPDVAAVYMPRLLFEQFHAGIKRTFIYELLSTNGEDFGLLDSTGNQKPAFKAVANLLNMLSDKGPTFTPSPVSYSVSGGSPAMHHFLLTKRDGTVYLALWLEVSSFNENAHTPIDVAPQQVTLTLPTAPASIKAHHWGADGNVTTAVLKPSTSVKLQVSEKVVLLELGSTHRSR